MIRTLSLALLCTALPAGIVVLAATVFEAISRPVRAVVRILVEKSVIGAAAHGASFDGSEGEVDPQACIGQPAELQVTLDGVAVRRFPLVVSAIALDRVHPSGHFELTIELAHALSRLALRADRRAFRDRTATEIVSEVLRNAGLDGAAFSVHRDLARRAFCVQHRESDLAFVSRLCEHEGIFYFLRGTDEPPPASPVLTFADHQRAFEPVAPDPRILLVDDDRRGEGVRELAFDTRAISRHVSLVDHDVRAPCVELLVRREAFVPSTGDWLEHAAGFESFREGDDLARIRLEEMLAHQHVGRGLSDRVALRAGAWFDLEGAARDALDRRYLVCSVEHRFVARSPAGPSARDADPFYENAFACIPYDRTYRPKRVTARPRIRGLETMVVTGPPGAEIHTDEMGRCKGRFAWGRGAPPDDRASCWMRVAQFPLSGSMTLARVGWEMGVVYLDGDPDRPIALARFDHAEHPPAYACPAENTRTALRTPSSPGAGGSNEIRIDDAAGRMELFVHAQKGFASKATNDKTLRVGSDEEIEVATDAALTVGAGETISIAGSRTITAGGSVGEKVGGSRSELVGGAEALSVGGQLAAVVGGADSEVTGGSVTHVAASGVEKSTKGNHALTVAGALVSAAGLDVSLAVAGAKVETIGGAKLVAAGGANAESVVGPLAAVVGGACVHAAGGARAGATTGGVALTIGGVASVTAGGKVVLTGRSVSVAAGGAATLVGGGGTLVLAPGLVAFGGRITLDASGTVRIIGNPNLVG